MLFSILPSLAALASCAIAAPTPSDTSLDMPHEMPSIEARNNLTALRLASRAADPPGGPITCYGSPPCITDGAASGCIFALELTKGAAHAWAVVVPGDSLSNYGSGSNTLAGGLLDNLRGQCGVITDWEAQSDDQNNMAARFSTTIFCGSDDVHNAIWLANGMNYEANCAYNDPTKIPWASGKITGVQVLFDLVGVLLPRT